ncbi:MAG: RdgB/HAM1 family non-canonical purine NTP pyrophosphatase [Actinobacteria bacterium]|nr:RdgB/HAM1 family non-canonical purine NTP pyrophosphatase [Actinomycetota bacterium]
MFKEKKIPVVIATKNNGKIREIKGFFNDIKKIKLLTFADFKDFPDVTEGSNSFFENAIIKAEEISKFTGKITLAEDSGLEVDALGGKPGVNSSIYAGKSATDKDNRIKLLDKLSGFSSLKDRTARFICHMIVWHPKLGMVGKSTGVCEGKIGFKEAGINGFGYDCIFIPEGYNKTMAQLSGREKNSISHRGKALRGLHDCLAGLSAEILKL